MGVFNKLKNIFYDEVVEEDPLETEEIKPIKKVNKVEEESIPKIEEIKTPVREEVKPIKVEEEVQNERDLFKNERTFTSFNFTQFDDDEEEVLPKKNVNVLDREVRNNNVKAPEVKVPEQPRVFKPTPVISPIYGILDKDYKKEEIKARQVTPEVSKPNGIKMTTYDSVRRKAYGTLEDELEDTLNSLNSDLSTTTISREMNKLEKNVDTIEEKTSKIEELINRIDEVSEEIDKTMSVGELEDSVHIDNFDDEEDDKTISSSTLEHDLFSLIDSMYDDKED